MNKGVINSEANILAAKRHRGIEPQGPGCAETAEKGLGQIRAGQFAEAVQAFRTAYEADLQTWK